MLVGCSCNWMLLLLVVIDFVVVLECVYVDWLLVMCIVIFVGFVLVVDL